MRTFLISYDLAHPNRNKHVLATAIMSLGASWARPLEQTWYVRAETSETDIEKRLTGLLDGDSGLIVQAVSDDAQLTNTSLRWFRQRRTPFEIDMNTNVIAFPLPATISAQAELPLAQAS